MAQGNITAPPLPANPPAPSPTAASDTGDTLLGQLPLPPIVFTGFADLAEGYSTNSHAGSGTGGKGDSFSRGRIGFDFDYNKPRLTANVSYSLTGTYWSKFHRQNHLTNRLNLTSRAVVVPDMLFVTANAFAAPADLTRAGPLSTSGEPISRYNSRDTYGYVVRPEFVLSYLDYLKNTLSASQGAVFFVRPSTDPAAPPPPINPALDSYYTTVTDELASGTYFEQLRFSVVGSYSQDSQSVRTQRDAQGLANISYAATRFLKVFGVGGYSDFKSSQPLAKDLSGPTALGGVTLSNTPEFVLTLEAGTQNNFPTYMGSLRWVISPLTQLVGNATDSITTPQGDMLARLTNMSGYGGGNFGDTGTGLGTGAGGGYSPYDPGGLALDNSIYHMRSIQLSLVHTDERTTYSGGLFGSERDRLDLAPGSRLPRTSVYGARLAVTQQIGTDWSAQLSANYSLGNEFGGHDRVFSGDARVNYHLTEAIDLYLSNGYTRRDSRNLLGFSNAPAEEDQIILGINARF